MIDLEHVRRTYGRKVAVADLTLQIAGGELFAFLGPNGAGKTTTIKMMVGLLRPTAGRLSICGTDAVLHPHEANRLVGYVPDQPHLYEKLSGREFLTFVAELYGLSPDAAEGQVERQIARFELQGFVDHLAESYSHGMKQRLAFAAALVHRPAVLILDEPMVGLDPRSVRLVKDLLRAEAAAGTSIFMSTHTLSMAEEIADRMGIIDRGELRFLGTVSELRALTRLHESSLEHLFLRLTEGDEPRWSLGSGRDAAAAAPPPPARDPPATGPPAEPCEVPPVTDGTARQEMRDASQADRLGGAVAAGAPGAGAPSREVRCPGGVLRCRPLGVVEESRVFWRLRRRIAGNLLRQLLAGSRLRIAVLALLSAIFWGGLLAIFGEAFWLLHSAVSHEATRAQTVHAIYNVFFLSLLVMLTLSSGILLYGNLYRSEEVEFLLTTPARTERIVMHKFQETLLFSGWGFLLMGSPMLLAYGIVVAAPWYYYALLLPFMFSFMVIPAGIGAVLCQLVVRYLPRVRLQLLVMAGGLAVAGLGGLAWMLLRTSEHDLMTPLWFRDALGRLRYSEQRVLPSWWLSSGLLEAAHPARDDAGLPAWRESLGFLAVLSSHALLVPPLIRWTARRHLRVGYSRLAGLATADRPVQPLWLDRLALANGWPLARPLRLMLVKDLRMFRRDPVHWSQFLIFFGLLGFYFLNVRRFHYGEPLDPWMTLIGFLNLAVVGLILATFTTRFIFPLISMEGRRFWILGTLPVSRGAILWSKLLFACAISLPPCAALILLSDLVLQIVQRAPLVALVHQVTCWVLCLGLSALAVGLGARLPNLREPSPARIAAGFGGTLNLVLSTMFILVTVLATGIPSYFWLAARRAGAPPAADGTFFALGGTPAVWLGVAAAILCGALVSVIPLRIGLRAFYRLEP